MALGWHVAMTHPREEALAAEHLGRQGFGVYLPRHARTRRHARKVERVAAPLFPRYVFVAFDPASAATRAIRSTRGVLDLVRSGPAPAAVPGWVVEGLRAREGVDGLIEIGDQLGLAPGDAVTITEGSFRGQTAIFDRLDEHGRVVALLQLLGRAVEVPVALADVDKA